MPEPDLNANDDRSLLDVAVAIADGSAVDWGAGTGAGSSGEASAVLAGLKSLERVVRGHEAVRSQSLAPSTPAAETLLTATQRAGGSRTPLAVHWGPLVILDKVGRGSFGDVYRAWDPRLEREVALKLVPEQTPESVSSPVVEEGRLLARVRHPNVLTVYGAERIDGRAGIWTEYLRGETLAQEVARRGPLTADETARIGIEVCRALDAVHGAGLLHRDVKAQNILRDATGRIALGDFGTGVEIDDQAAVASAQIAGTPLYLAPELFDGQPASIATDLYSVGVLLYFLVTGTYPVRGGTAAEVRRAHERGERVPLRSAGTVLPDSFVDVVEALLDSNREHRFPTASTVESALGRSLSAKPRPRAWIVGGVAAAIVMVALVASFATRTGPVAAPVAPGDWILVAAIDNQTGEATFDRAAETALKRELEYSEHVRVAQRDRWEDALEILGRPDDTRLDASLARQVSLLDGNIRRVVAGSIGRDGRWYTVTIRIVDPASGTTLATLAETADRSQITTAVRRSVLRLRAAFGEPEKAVEKARTDLEHVKAPLLEALSFHSRGLARADVRNTPRTVALRHERWTDVERLERSAIEADPAFGYAWIMLAWALKNQDRPRDDYLPLAQRAVGLIGTATPQERYFIEGSLHDMRVFKDTSSGTTDNRQELEQAVRAYEALFALQPDHYYVLNNLTAAYTALRRDRDLAQLRIRLADARPANVVLNLYAVGHLVDSGNLEAARRYAARAEAAAALKDAGRDLVGQANAAVWRAWLDWYEGNLQEALTRATRAEAMLDRIPLETAAARPRLIFLYLTLGRLKAAQAFAERSRIWDSTTPYMLAYALRERGDLDGLRTYLTEVWTHDHWSPATSIGWRVEFLVPAGMLHEAARDIERYRRQTPPAALGSAFYPFLMGQLETGRGHPREVVRHLEPWLAAPTRATVLMNLQGPLQWLAHAWTLLGDKGKALELLERGTAQRPTFESPNHHQWLRTNAQLARSYRQQGHVAKARVIEDRLRKLLAVADADHPLLLELKSLEGDVSAPRPTRRIASSAGR